MATTMLPTKPATPKLPFYRLSLPTSHNANVSLCMRDDAESTATAREKKARSIMGKFSGKQILPENSEEEVFGDVDGGGERISCLCIL